MKKVIYLLVAVMATMFFSNTAVGQVTTWTTTTTPDSACVTISVNPTAVPMKVVYSLNRGDETLMVDSFTTSGVIFGFKITFSNLDASTTYTANWDVTLGSNPTNSYFTEFKTDEATGVGEIDTQQDQFKAYCNGNQVTLITPAEFIGQVMVYNLAGQLVATQAMASSNATIRLETGVYFVSFLGANGAKVATKEIAVVK